MSCLLTGRTCRANSEANRDRLAGESHKLDFVTLALVVNMHNSPHVSGGEPFFGTSSVSTTRSCCLIITGVLSQTGAE
jgi:hypothetical protein